MRASRLLSGAVLVASATLLLAYARGPEAFSIYAASMPAPLTALCMLLLAGSVLIMSVPHVLALACARLAALTAGALALSSDRKSVV